MWSELTRLRWPEIQAPFYMAYVWGWLKVFGHAEWTARLAGLPFFVAGAFLFVTSWRTPVQRASACVNVCASAFFWFYLNEARLYSLQLGLTFTTIAALIRLKQVELHSVSSERIWFGVFCLGTVLLSMVNILGMIWTSAGFLILPVLFSQQWLLRLSRRNLGFLAVGCMMLGLTAAYYIWTRRMGIHPTRVGRTDWRACGFDIYELLGFNGLGPGRLSLREGGIQTLKPWLPLIALFGCTLVVVLLAGFLELLEHIRLRRLAFAALALTFPAAFITMIALTSHFRVLARHLTPMAGIVLVLLTIGMSRLWRSGEWLKRTICLLAISLSLSSCLCQRFSPRHAKDDYRGAALIANSELLQGHSVWWNADEFGAGYYRVPTTNRPLVPGKAWLCFPTLGFNPTADKPNVVITSSKSDIYDPTRELRSFLSKEHYVKILTLQAFEIFQKPAANAAAR